MAVSRNGIWASRKNELIEMAKTMTSSQIGEVYGITRRGITEVLAALGIKAYNPQNIWHSRCDELRELALSMTPIQLAKKYGITPDAMRDVMRKFDIPYLSTKQNGLSEYGLIIAKLGETMTIPQIADKTGKSTNSLYDYIKRHKIKVQRTDLRSFDFWVSEKSNIEEMSETMPACNIAIHYDISPTRMRTVMREIGVKCFKPAKKEKIKKEVKNRTSQLLNKQNREIPMVRRKNNIPNTGVEKIIIMPDNVKIQTYTRPVSTDPRCVMAAPVWNPNKRNFLNNYA